MLRPRESSSRSREPRRRLSLASPYLLAGLLGVSGIAHFVAPAPYASIIPRVLPARTALVYLSGVAELACAVGLVLPRPRRRAGWATGALFVAVWPANLTMALAADGRSPTYTALVWLRLPVQIPLIAWAVSVARRPEP
ncbi:MAG: hypothetical protein ABJC62_06720 [Frankiaceae bacterium]